MLVMWKGQEDVRAVRKGDLGLDPEDDTELVWSAETRFTQEVTEEEFELLRKAGGNWAVVEEISAAPEGESASIDESSTDQDVPQEGVKAARNEGKTPKA